MIGKWKLIHIIFPSPLFTYILFHVLACPEFTNFGGLSEFSKKCMNALEVGDEQVDALTDVELSEDGLRSSLLWALSLIGAEIPEEQGL